MSQSKQWPTSKLLTSGCQLPNKTDSTWTTPPSLGVLGQKDYLPQQTSREQETIKKYPLRRLWPWPKLSRGVQSILGCLWGSSVELCRSSMSASCGERRWSVWPLDAKCGWEGAQGPQFGRGGLITDITVGGSWTPRGTFCGVHTMRTTTTPWVQALMGRWIQPTSPWGGWPAYDPAPRIPNGSCLIWHHGMDGLPLHSCRGDTLPMSDPGHCTNNPIADPVQIHGSIWILSTGWRNLSRCNALSLTHEWLYHSQTIGKWLEMCMMKFPSDYWMTWCYLTLASGCLHWVVIFFGGPDPFFNSIGGQASLLYDNLTMPCALWQSLLYQLLLLAGFLHCPLLILLSGKHPPVKMK